ncbi:MAG: T9SS type A sorting domain-containing protein, partial [Flavobacteriales bacterium]
SIGSHDNAVFIVGDSGMVYTNNPDIANKVENIDPVNSSLIYPNPCSEKVTIEKSTNEKVRRILLFDSMGKEVFNSPPPSEGIIQLELPELAHGIYTLQISFKSKIEQHQLVID